MSLNPLKWIDTAFNGAINFGKVLTKKGNTIAEGNKILKEAEAYTLRVGADNTSKQMDLNKESVKQLNGTWKDEFLIIILTPPLWLPLPMAIFLTIGSTIDWFTGDIATIVYIEQFKETMLIYGASIKSITDAYWEIVMVIVFGVFGYRGYKMKGIKDGMFKTETFQKVNNAVSAFKNKKKVKEQNMPMAKVIANTRNQVTALSIKHLKANEGYSSTPYQCTSDKLTIGYGLNLETSFTKEMGDLLLEVQVDALRLKLQKHDWYNNLDAGRKAAVVRACFWLGLSGFIKGFPNCIAALTNQSWQEAHNQFMDSKMGRGEMNTDGGADGMKNRCIAIATIFLTGEE